MSEAKISWGGGQIAFCEICFEKFAILSLNSAVHYLYIEMFSYFNPHGYAFFIYSKLVRDLTINEMFAISTVLMLNVTVDSICYSQCKDKYLRDANGGKGLRQMQKWATSGDALVHPMPKKVSKLFYIIVRLLQNARYVGVHWCCMSV